MRKLKWLYPGMRIKRWIFLIIFGISMLAMGFVLTIAYPNQSSSAEAGAGFVIIVGLAATIIGIRKIIKTVISIFLPEKREKELVDLIYRKRYLEKGPRIVVIGGGSGLYQLLSGLKEYSSNITALITVQDDEGVIGKLRESSSAIESSDIKSAIVALADAGNIVNTLFNFRFRDMSELWGYDFGDIFLTAVSRITGDLEKAINEASYVLGARGRVLLSTRDRVMLTAEYVSGECVYGKKEILKQSGKIKKISMQPKKCTLNSKVKEDILKADVIVIGPGSLYTSVLPSMMIGNAAELISKANAHKIFVCNTMTQAGQTEGFKASDHVKTLLEISGANKLFNNCLVNNMVPNEDVVKRYSLEDAHPVTVDTDDINRLGIKVFAKDLLSRDAQHAKHESRALAKAIVDTVITLRSKRS